MATAESLPGQVYDYDPATPFTGHPDLAAAMFPHYFEALDPGAAILNVAAGRTNLQGDLYRRHPTVSVMVTSLDPAYADNSGYSRVRGVAEEIPYEGDSFDLTLCQFGLQHMRDPGQAIAEMVRVTRPATGAGDNRSGVIILNPVFADPEVVKGLLLERGFGAFVTFEYPPTQIKRGTKDVLPSLILHKTDQLTPDRITELAELAEQSRFFVPDRRTVREHRIRLFKGHRGRWRVL